MSIHQVNRTGMRVEAQSVLSPTAIARPSWTEMKMTPANAQTHTRKSILSIFQMWYTAGKSIRPITAAMMIAPRTTLGVYTNSGMRNSSVTITVSAMITLDMAVLQPALWFTAERENAPTYRADDHYSLSSYSLVLILEIYSAKRLVDSTCCYVAWCAGPNNIHQPYGHHLFVSIYLVVLEWGKCSTNRYSFLQWYSNWCDILVLETCQSQC